MKSLAFLPILCLSSVSGAQEPDRRWSLELETGVSATRYNSARVPKSTGTELDLADLVGKGWKAFGRVSLAFEDRAGGTWKLLYAPSRQSGNGSLDGPANFDGRTFAAGDVKATYQFNSYRLTYRKPWKGNWSLGGTLKVRDAEIRLKQGPTVASERNVGIVPLLNVYGAGAISRGFMYEVELDGLAGGPGRAIDLSLRVKRPIGSGASAFVGYRLLEGGADVPRVKNFAWVNYLTAGVAMKF